MIAWRYTHPIGVVHAIPPMEKTVPEKGQGRHTVAKTVANRGAGGEKINAMQSVQESNKV